MKTWTIPSDADIAALLRERIDGEGEGVGMVVGVIDRSGRRIVSHGSAGGADPRPLDADTVFEIGSITKAFTALLLADMALRGEVALDDPVARFLPAGVTMPRRPDREITLIDLATHTSGLPRRPTEMARDEVTPYAGFTVERLHSFLNGYALRRDIGVEHRYSNLGLGLLGHALALRAGVGYEALVRERITVPLGMPDTAITLSPSMAARLCVGHDHERRPTPNWDLGALAGAGGLRSTATDLLTLIAAELGLVQTPLAEGMAAQIAPRRPSDVAGREQALGWVVSPDDVGEIVWHGGQTGGYRCLLLFNRERGAGVAVLGNASAPRNDDIPFHLLAGQPLSAERPVVALEADEMRRCVGRYEFLSPTLQQMTITLDDERLFARLTGQQAFEVFPESPTRIFWKIVNAHADFEVAADGRVTGLVLHQRGRDMPARRL